MSIIPHPALVATREGAFIAAPGGGGPVRAATRSEAIRAAADTPHLLINAPLTAARLGYPELSGLDLLELFAFIHPARFAVPSASGLATALGIAPPAGAAEEAAFLHQAADALLAAPADPAWPARAGAHGSAQALSRARWPWAPLVTARIAAPPRPEPSVFAVLPRWEDKPQRPRPRTIALDPAETHAQLARALPPGAEDRAGQRDYAAAAAHAFAPREAAGAPNLVLAEAGTGIGKTLGYLAPAALWAERAGGTVWISTYTKALQRQLARDARRIFPGAGEVVVRKGRENYLCLLNLEDATQGAFAGRAGVFAHLVARWARYSADGDLVGGDLPGWLPALFGRSALGALTDRRGECVYAGCPHYRACFTERAARASAEARLVIANHALVMANAVRARAEAQALTRLVFDEGHHLFDAADSAFALALSGAEAIELRRWLLGPERNLRGRRRGLSARLADLASYDDAGASALAELLEAARALPAEGWLPRIMEGAPEGPVEALLGAARAVVLARAEPGEIAYGLETEAAELPGTLIDAAAAASAALARLLPPCARLMGRIAALIEAPPEWLDASARARLEAASSGLLARAQLLEAWLDLLGRLGGAPDPAFVDWLALDRSETREYDVAVRRHWLDPTKPFAGAVLAPAHGALITSATLGARGEAAAAPEDWRDTEHRTGATHLPLPPRRFRAESPFDYAAHARVLVVTDVDRRNPAATAGAYARLIEASGGGCLGLFTAIHRLKAAVGRLAGPLAEKGLPLIAQHVDPIDPGTLVDMFRSDPGLSLFGTDALRDGVDVPGHALRLVVLEGVPWPRRTVLHAARRAAFGGSAYDDLIVSGRIAQAFGRLIRTAADRGVFVILGAAVPSRLLGALPPGAQPLRVPLGEACRITSQFLALTPARPTAQETQSTTPGPG